jgi:hypothetical protein
MQTFAFEPLQDVVAAVPLLPTRQRERRSGVAAHGRRVMPDFSQTQLRPKITITTLKNFEPGRAADKSGMAIFFSRPPGIS